MSTRRRPDDDFDREIRAHLDIEAQRLIDDGMPPEEARAAAQRRFGNVTRVRERRFETRRTLWLDHLRQDVRCAVRNLRRYPVVTLVAVLSLAGGIGATTVTLTIRDVLFHKPPALYREPGQLSRVQVDRIEEAILPLGSPVPVALYLAWRDQFGLSIAASSAPRGVRDVRAGDRTETAPVRAVTPQLFDVLGVGPALGTLFPSGQTPADTRRPVDRGTPPAVLSDRLWERLFDRRPEAIGGVIWIDDQPHTVVGVMPGRFWFSETNAPAWIPLDAQALSADDRVEVVVRRPAGVTAATLREQLQSGLAEFAARQPADRRQWRLEVSDVKGTPLGHQLSPILTYVLGTSVLLTMLIACANVAILMIAQWTAREHEIAIRASIGASRGRIVRALLTESVLIAAIAGAAGVCATFALRAWVLSRAPAGVSLFDVSLDPSIFGWTAAITLLTGIAVGIAPALYETRRLHINPLKTLGTSDRVRQRWRHALVVGEITVTVGLCVQTVALLDGWQRARSAQLGFDRRPLLSARVENPGGVPTARLLESLDSLAGVSAAAASTGVPFTTAGRQVRVGTEAAGAEAVTAEETHISAGYFVALGVPLRAGRVFAAEDSTPARTAIVNETLARRLFGERSPIGVRVWVEGTAHEVVGVVADYSNNPLHPGRAQAKVFRPLPPFAKDISDIHLLIRAAGDPAPLVETVRRSIVATFRGTTVVNAFTIDGILEVMSQEILLGTAPLLPLIAVAVFLTTSGIYGVLTFAITRRSRELAVRVAVGASGRDLVRLVAFHGLRLVGVGSALGIAVTLGLARVVRASGGGGTIFDPEYAAFVFPLVIVLVIAAVSMWVPARRALKIDPAALLRSP